LPLLLSSLLTVFSLSAPRHPFSEIFWQNECGYCSRRSSFFSVFTSFFPFPPSSHDPFRVPFQSLLLIIFAGPPFLSPSRNRICAFASSPAAPRQRSTTRRLLLLRQVLPGQGAPSAARRRQPVQQPRPVRVGALSRLREAFGGRFGDRGEVVALFSFVVVFAASVHFLSSCRPWL
jgi:hypothetical protein